MGLAFGARLQVGMFGQVRIDLDDNQTFVTVPETAVEFRPYGNSVYKIIEGDEGLTVENTLVSTGALHHGRIAILDGLAAGDRVVAYGHNKLRNGASVQVAETISELSASSH